MPQPEPLPDGSAEPHSNGRAEPLANGHAAQQLAMRGKNRPFESLSVEEMHALFNSLPDAKMNDQMTVGVQFLNDLLDKKGPEVTSKFIRGALFLLMTDGQVNDYDLWKRLGHDEVFQDTRKKFDRRLFLKLGSQYGVFTALTWGSTAGLLTLEGVDSYNERKEGAPKTPATPADTSVNNTSSATYATVHPHLAKTRKIFMGALVAADVAIAGTILVEARAIWKDATPKYLNSISDAVAEVGHRYPKMRPVFKLDEDGQLRAEQSDPRAEQQRLG